MVQEHDLPEIRLRVTQHDVYRVRCRCGREHVGALPAGVSPAPVSYGAHLKSLVVYLLAYQHVPIERCVELISDLSGGTGPSAGFVHGMLTRCANAVRPVVIQIKKMITRAPVAGFDETTLRAGAAGQKHDVLSASTEYYTAYHLGRRDLASFTAFGILPHFAGIAVHDRYQNYYHHSWTQLAGHQACCAHLLRDFTDAAESYPGTHWPEQAQRALRGLIHAAHHARDTGLSQIPAPAADPLISEFRHAIRVGLSQIPRIPGPKHSTKQLPSRDLLEFCRDRETDVLRFASDTRIWPTNNLSERDLRPTKTQQKISGRLTSEDTTQDRLDIRGYLDTVRKHRGNALTSLHAALTGNPWYPPIPTPT